MGAGAAGSEATVKGGRRLGVGVLIGAVTAAAVLVPVVAVAAPVSMPTLTDPVGGQVITTPTLSVTAQSGAGEVLFVLDERAGQFTTRAVVDVGTGEATATLPTLGLNGSTSLDAYDCDLGGDCNTSGDTLNVSIQLTPPTLTEPRNNAVVGDSFVAKATAANGAIGFLLDGKLTAVDKTKPFSAKISMASKGAGSHTIRAVQCSANGQVCEGARSNTRTVIKDTRGPTWTSVSADPKTFYPVNDNYKDSTKLSARVGEDADSVRVVIRSGAKTVRTLDLGRESRGKVVATWNGRDKRGDVVRAGRYTYQFSGKDRYGNASTSSRRDVVVSDKRLVRKTGSKTVSVRSSIVGNISGNCSSVYELTYDQARFDWPNGGGYYSRSKCNGSASDDVAAGLHRVGLPKAVRYGSVKVDTYGAGAFRHAGPGVILYLKGNKEWGAARQVSASLGWHSGPNASLSKYVLRGGFYWAFATLKGNWYDVKEFRVSYSYSVLR